MANIKGIIVEIGGDTSKLQDALKKVNSSTASLSKELKGINSLLKLDPKNTELVAQKQTVLKENIEETSKKLEELKKAQQMADETIANGGEISQENYRNLQREIINTQNKLNNLQVEASNWTKAGRSIEEFGNKVTNISDKIDKMGTTLTTRLTLPITAIATAAVTTGNDFEAQMSRVQAIAGATKEELEQLTNQAIELGAKTSFSASEVAQGMENLASAGFTTNEIISAMPGLLDLAASSGAELATASEITASALRGFGLEANNSAHIADVFAEAAARTNAQTEDMGEAMKYVAPIAKTVGLSIEETAAAIGIMSDAGIKGSQAGTTLRGGLTRIVKPTKMVRDAMEELGVEFYNSNGKMKSLTEIIKTLQEHTKGLTDETKNQALAQIFGTEALSGMLSLVNRGSDELSNMTKSFKECDGAAAEMAETMLDNTSGSLESLTGSFESAGVIIQKALAPEIKKLAKWLQGLVDDFTELSEEEQLNIIKTTALVAAIGPSIKILSKLGSGLGAVTNGIGKFSQAIVVAKNNTTATTTSINNLAKVISFAKSPLGLLTVGVAGLTTALWLAGQKSDESVVKAEKQIEVLNKQKETLNELRTTQEEYLGTNLAEIENVKTLKDELLTLVDANGKVKEGYDGRVKFILGELNNALGTEYNLTDGIISKYQELTQSIDEVIEKKKANIILDSMEESYTNALKSRSDAIKNLAALEKNYASDKEKIINKENEKLEIQKKKQDIYTLSRINKLNEEIKTLQSNVDAYEEQKDKIIEYNTTIDKYETASATIKEGNVQKIQELNNQYTNSYRQRKDDTIQSLSEQLQYESINLALQQETYKQNQSQITKNQIEESKKRLNDLAQELVNATSTISELTPEQVEAWSNLGKGSYGTYSEYISKLPQETQQKIQDATGIIAAKTPEMQEMAKELGSKTVQEFDKSLDAKEKAINTIIGYLSGLTDEEKRVLLKQAGIENADIILQELDKGNLSEENGRNILEGLWRGLKNNTWRGKILGVASGLAQAVNNAFTGKDGWDIHSPSKKMQEFTEYYMQPISDVIKKRQKGIVATASNLANSVNSVFNNKLNIPQIQDLGKLQGSLSNQIIESTKMICTTPNIVFNVQELDEDKLQQCFNYINKKFGTQY